MQDDSCPYYGYFIHRYSWMPRDELMQLLRIALWKSDGSWFGFYSKARREIMLERREQARQCGVTARQFEAGLWQSRHEEITDLPASDTPLTWVEHEHRLRSLGEDALQVLWGLVNGKTVYAMAPRYGYIKRAGKTTPKVKLHIANIKQELRA